MKSWFDLKRERKALESSFVSFGGEDVMSEDSAVEEGGGLLLRWEKRAAYLASKSRRISAMALRSDS